MTEAEVPKVEYKDELEEESEESDSSIISPSFMSHLKHFSLSVPQNEMFMFSNNLNSRNIDNQLGSTQPFQINTVKVNNLKGLATFREKSKVLCS